MSDHKKRWKATNRKVLKAMLNSEEESDVIQSSYDSDSVNMTFSDGSVNLERNSLEQLEGNISDIPSLVDSDSDLSDSNFIFSDSDINDEDIFEGNENEKSLHNDLAACAIRNKWTRASINELLLVLRKQGLELPKDARSLLKTPRAVAVSGKCGGDYCYFGIQSSVERILKNSHENFLREIELKFNVDGLPIYKSKATQFWPILGQIGDSDVFMVALYCGNTKPYPLAEYLEDFLTELQELLNDSMEYCGEKIEIKLKCFLCDAPARAYLKGIIAHTGYSSCEMCCIKGGYEGRVVFNEEEKYPARQNHVFKEFRYEDHQTSISPLTNLNIDFIKAFPLAYMHLICLGVVRRITYYWRKGPCGKISSNQLNEISSQLVSYRGTLPSEFCRQPRSLNELDRWKATEFRQFLLYTGPVVLRRILSNDAYHHFLVLSVSISILLQCNDAVRNSRVDYAKSLLEHFVNNCKFIYGRTFTVYNVHNLLHIADDCINFNCSLNEISCFPFENFLQRLKKTVKNSSNPLVQVSKRQIEFDSIFGSLPKKQLFLKISTRKKDNCFLTENSVAFVKSVIEDGTYICDCYKFKTLESVFEIPSPSKLFDIYLIPTRVKNKFTTDVLTMDGFKRKCVCLEESRGWSVFPLLHEIERKNI